MSGEDQAVMQGRCPCKSRVVRCVSAVTMLVLACGIAACGNKSPPVHPQATMPSPPSLGLADVLAEPELAVLTGLLGDAKVAERDERVQAAARAADRPSRRCLIVDTIIPRFSGVSSLSTTILLADLERLDSLGDAARPGDADHVPPAQWRFVERYLVRVLAQRPPPRDQSSLLDVAAITYFDGRGWRKQVWTNMGSLDAAYGHLDFSTLMTLSWYFSSSEALEGKYMCDPAAEVVRQMLRETAPIWQQPR